MEGEIEVGRAGRKHIVDGLVDGRAERRTGIKTWRRARQGQGHGEVDSGRGKEE